MIITRYSHIVCESEPLGQLRLFLSPQSLLRTLTYQSTAAEPSAGLRSLTITTTSASETQDCTVTIAVLLVNDHLPEIDLSGPASPGVDHFTSLNYSIFTQNRVSIAAGDASISDEDLGAIVVGMEVALVSGHDQDRLVLSDEVCLENNQTICHLRYK